MKRNGNEAFGSLILDFTLSYRVYLLKSSDAAEQGTEAGFRAGLRCQ
jgi:hypothetical protein